MRDHFRFGDYDFNYLLEDGIAARAAERNFKRGFNRAVESIEPLMVLEKTETEDWNGRKTTQIIWLEIQEKFYEILNDLRDMLFVSGYRKRDTKHCLDEFVCQSVTSRGHDHSYEDLMRFYATYKRLCGLLYGKLNDAGKGYGSDGFGDMIDSFPLAGRKAIEAALSGDIQTPLQLRNTVNMAVSVAEDSAYILQGENYHQMTFEDQLVKRFVSAAQDFLKTYDEDAF